MDARVLRWLMDVSVGLGRSRSCLTPPGAVYIYIYRLYRVISGYRRLYIVRNKVICKLSWVLWELYSSFEKKDHGNHNMS